MHDEVYERRIKPRNRTALPHETGVADERIGSVIIWFVECNSGVFIMAVEGSSPQRDQCRRKKDRNNVHPSRVPIPDSQNQPDIPRWKHLLEVRDSTYG